MRPETRKKRMLRQMIDAATNSPKFTLATPAVIVTTLNGMGVNPFATMTRNALSTYSLLTLSNAACEKMCGMKMPDTDCQRA
jgi:hypothetical protein